MFLCFCIITPVPLICLRRYEHERDRRLLIQKKIDELNMFMKQCAAPDAKHPCLHLTLLSLFASHTFILVCNSHFLQIHGFQR